ncbi:MAG: T9SS type A sorting domain-containing protein [Spirochaetes bacterium]|nr:T9SS type A sorting domain-containing protein [Spirochaetota bacterium]
MRSIKIKNHLLIKKYRVLIFVILISLILTSQGYSDFVFSYDISPAVYYGSIVLGDIDSDGDLDLVMSGQSSSARELKIYVNNGAGIFNIHQIFNPGLFYSSITLSDIDNDGDPDLIVTGSDGAAYHFKVYKNNGAGIFSLYQNLSPGVYLSSIATGDIDFDGDIDLIMIGDGAGYLFTVYMNNGEGFFSQGQSLSPGVDFGSIALGDIDSDNDLDLVMTGFSTGPGYNFKIYTNNGSGNFSESQSLTGLFTGGSSFGDIDSDGDIDLLISGTPDGSVNSILKVYTNNSTGIFNESQNINPGAMQSSIVLGDTDCDGDLDLIAAGFASGPTRYFRSYTNNGTGAFYYKDSPAPGIDSCSIAIADLDNDKDIDLVITGSDGGTLYFRVYMNQESTLNQKPSIPTGLKISTNNGCYRFTWNPSTDDHTSQNLLRYHIAIGTTSSGVYDYASDYIALPRGQANIGNVLAVGSAPYYQSRIPETESIWWKVCALDTSFISSGYSEEQSFVPPVELKGEPTLDNIIIGPNPYKPNDSKTSSGTVSSGIIFSKLTDDAAIEIYTVGGQLVEKLEETNHDGKYVWVVPTSIPSGVYLCRISNSKGEQQTRKIVIIK